ncbi:hypothetical protein BGZ76_003385, partial [Entomortierella beljakovae]
KGKPSAFKNIEASDLTIWHVSIPVNGDASDEAITANNIDTKKLLMATTASLSGTFKNGIPEGTIHIVIERPKVQVKGSERIAELLEEIENLRNSTAK